MARVSGSGTSRAYEHSGYVPDEIADLYPALTLSDDHTSLAYYYAHIEEFTKSVGTPLRYKHPVKHR
jgi:hypothetical protein